MSTAAARTRIPARPTKAKAGKAFPASRRTRPTRGATFPRARLRRHAPAYRALVRCGRLRLPAGPARCLSVRARRGSHGLERPAGQALAAARFPGRRRPLGQHGLLPRPARGQARTAGRPDGPQMVRHDPGGQGRRGGARDHRAFSQGTFPKALVYRTRHARLPAPGRRRSTAAEQYNDPGPVHRVHRLRVDLALPGQQPPPQRDLPRQRRQGQPGRAVHRVRRWAATTRRPVEMDGRLRREDRRQRPGHRAQRQPQQRPDVPGRRGLRQADRSRVRRDAREVGAALRGRRRPRATARAHPFLSPNDEFADFESWDKGNLDGSEAKTEGDARVRVCALGAQERPEARSRSSASIPTSSA